MSKTKFKDRVTVFVWWTLMGFAWFVAIFWNKIYDAQETWLKNYAKKYNEKHH